MRCHARLLRGQPQQFGTSHGAAVCHGGVRSRLGVGVALRARATGSPGFLSLPLESELDSQAPPSSTGVLPPLESELPPISVPEPDVGPEAAAPPGLDAALLDNGMVPYWDPAQAVDEPPQPPPKPIRPTRPMSAAATKPASAPAPAPKPPAPAKKPSKSKAPSTASVKPGPAAAPAAPSKSAGGVIRPTPRRQATLSSSFAPVAPSRSTSPPPPSTASTAGAGGALDAPAIPGLTARSSSPALPDAPVLQPETADPAAAPSVDWAYQELPMQGFLMLRSEEEELASASRTIELPPLQSVLELTTAFKPPSKSLEAVEEVQSETATEAAPVVGRQLADGTGTLLDGTTYEKLSGEDVGPNGFWKRWTILKGASADGLVTFEECWWESSDYSGLKELGATKSGTSALGGAWKESWTEKAYHDPTTVELVIERTAHKWARADGGEGADEWEEKWGEKHKALGEVTKYADKWAKSGNNIWHEKWGEDYNGKGACTKWTDKWAERLHYGGAREQWGDKWTEVFGDGRGSKHGEVWSVGGGGERYNRWWNEEHMGNGQVRKYGNSTHGENWDVIEHMDTYYNPIPHFGFALAVRHSPGLMKIPMKPRDASPDAGSGATAGGKQSGEALDSDTLMLMQGMDAFNMSDEEEEEQQQPEPAPVPAAVPAASAASAGAGRRTASKSPVKAPGAGGPAAAAAPGEASLDWSEVLASVQSKVDAVASKPAIQKARSNSASPGPASPPRDAPRDASKVDLSRLLNLASASAPAAAGSSKKRSTSPSSGAAPAAPPAVSAVPPPAAAQPQRKAAAAAPPPPPEDTSGLGGGLDLF